MRNEHWTDEAPEKGRLYWIIKHYADGSYSHPCQRVARSEYALEGEGEPRGNWRDLARDYWMRSVDPIVPPPLPPPPANGGEHVPPTPHPEPQQ